MNIDMRTTQNQPRKLVSFKLQYFLGLIPFFGFFVVVFCGFFNIKKVTNVGWFNYFPRMALYWICLVPVLLLSLVPSAIIIAIGLPQQLENQGLMILVILIMFIVPLIVVAILAVLLQQRFIKKYSKNCGD